MSGSDAPPGEGVSLFHSSRVTRQIGARLPEIQLCFERELRDDEHLAGRVVVRLTIVPNGAVTDAHAIESTTGSDAVAIEPEPDVDPSDPEIPPVPGGPTEG